MDVGHVTRPEVAPPQASRKAARPIGRIRFAHLLREKKVHSRTFSSIPQPRAQVTGYWLHPGSPRCGVPSGCREPRNSVRGNTKPR